MFESPNRPGLKKLVFEIETPALLDDVWTAFATSAGLSTWLTPGAVVDLRKGGEWTAHFPGGATGGRTRAFESPGDKVTRVNLRQTGWKPREDWDKDCNAQLLETLRRRFETGPIDWAKEWGHAK
jgi:uncharacterized protein YndB with AHSA1/START domain